MIDVVEYRRSSGTQFIYIIAVDNGTDSGPCKIGISGNYLARLRELQTGCPYKLKLVHAFAVPNRVMATQIERVFHDVQKQARTQGEWFDLPPFRCLELLCMCFEAGFAVFLSEDSKQDLPDIRRAVGLNAAKTKLDNHKMGHA